MTVPADWYFRRCEAVLAAARAENVRRALRGCVTCDVLFLTPAMAPDAEECGYCWRRAIREHDEAADRNLYLRWKAGEVSDLVAGMPVEGERVPVGDVQMSLL